MIKFNRNKSQVGVIKIKKPYYPREAPFHPSTCYTEYSYKDHISSKPNYVYKGIRELFLLLGFDKAHFNTPQWNPLGHLIEPGMTVVIKPNFVLSKNENKKTIYSIITHPSVIRVIVDYCQIALDNKGKIIIADTPQYNCNFQELLEATKLAEISSFINQYNESKVEIKDLRKYWSKSRHFPSCCKDLPGDINGEIIVNLKKQSAFVNHPNPKQFYGAVYNRNETISHHYKEKQEYELSRTIFNADVIISVPKLKVHKKVGVTLNLKGLVGITTNKNFLPHYTLGTPSEGGDQYPEGLLTNIERKVIKFERWMYDHFLAKNTIKHEIIHRLIYGFFYLKIFRHFGLRIPKNKRLFDAGNWYGNDTAWRMVVDLAKIIHFVDKDGELKKPTQRRLFSIIDGVIGGENNGPLIPDPKSTGILIGGKDLLAVDLVATRLMGFDSLKLKQFTELDPKYDFGSRKLEDIEIISNETSIIEKLLNKKNRIFNFKPHPGWEGYIEI